jgi:hypothetical protein
MASGDGAVKRSYVFRLRPTPRQHLGLTACLQSHRELYNAALQERRDAWARSKTRIHYRDQSAQLTGIRAERLDLAIWFEKKLAVSSRQRSHDLADHLCRARRCCNDAPAGADRLRDIAQDLWRDLSSIRVWAARIDRH